MASLFLNPTESHASDIFFVKKLGKRSFPYLHFQRPRIEITETIDKSGHDLARTVLSYGIPPTRTAASCSGANLARASKI
jgi:hypothetical protein